MPSPRSTISAAALWLVSVALGAAAGPPAVDPIEWPEPAAMPPFRARVAEDVFGPRFATATEKFQLDALAADRGPVHGFEITRIQPGSAAELLGLVVGDTITHVDNITIWPGQSLPNESANRTMRVVRDSTLRTIDVPPGKIGVWGEYRWRPITVYLRSDRHGAAWDKLIVEAINHCDDDPDYAETCLHHAVAAGYRPDYLGAYLGAILRWHQRDNDASADYAWYAMRARPSHGEMLLPTTLVNLCMANFKLDAVVDVMRRDPGAFASSPAEVERLALLHKRRTPAQRTLPTPSVLAQTMYHDNVLPRLAAMNDYTLYFVEGVRAGDELHLTPQASHYTEIYVAPSVPMRDVEMSVTCVFRATDENETRFDKCVEVALVDRKYGQNRRANYYDHGWDLARAGLSYNGVLSVSYGNRHIRQSVFTPAVVADGNTQMTVRLVRVGGQVEVFLNGMRVLYAPVDEAINNVGCSVKAVGSTATFSNLKIDELIPRG